MTRISQETISHLCELSCECVAERLGIDVCRHKALCFIHDDHHPSLSFFGNNRQRWFCFVCNKGGNAIDLVLEKTEYNFVEACLWLCQEFNIPTDFPVFVRKSIKSLQFRKKVKAIEEKKFFIKEVAQWILDNNSLTEQGKDFLFTQRLLDPQVIKDLNIISIDNSKLLIDNLKQIFDYKTLEKSGLVTISNGKTYFRMFTPCLIFPYYDQQRNLVGLQSRYLGTNKDAPRFQFISMQKTRLFNLPILETMKPGEDLYISEGITDCLSLLSFGKKAVAIPSATILPQYDLLDLKEYKLHMFPDQDEAGRQAYIKLRNFFVNLYTIVKENRLPANVKDFSEFYIKKHG